MADIGDMWMVTGKNVILHDGPFETSLSFNSTHGVTSQNSVLFKQQTASLSLRAQLWHETAFSVFLKYAISSL